MNKESERKRLVELLRKGIDKHESTIENYVAPIWEFLADHLLDNGIVVPPFPIGERVFVVITNMPFVPDDVYECEVRHYSVTKEDARPFVEIKSDLSINGLTFLAYPEDVFTSMAAAQTVLELKKKKKALEGSGDR